MGILPEIDRSVADSAPAAAVTFCACPIWVTAEDFSVPSAPVTSTSRLNFWPALGLAPEVGAVPRTRNPNGPPEPWDGAVVTVMSVPTPYSE